MRPPLVLILVLVLAGCASVRTIDLEPTPTAVATYVASTLGGSAPERISVIGGDSLLATWRRAYPLRLAALIPIRSLDRVETFEAGGAIVDVFIYRTPLEDYRGVRDRVDRLRSVYGRQPLDGPAPGPIQTAFFAHETLVVRVITTLDRPDMGYTLDDGLGRPLINSYPRSPMVALGAKQTYAPGDWARSVERRYNARMGK